MEFVLVDETGEFIKTVENLVEGGVEGSTGGKLGLLEAVGVEDLSILEDG
jgi:hypothetical protein